MLDFTKMDISAVVSGMHSDGERYLSKFLKEYTSLFPGAVNPSCMKCLNDYLKKYKKAMAKNTVTAENSGYKLHKKYEGIPLEFGSPVLVTNANLSDAYAEKLLARKNGAALFAEVPADAKPKAAKPKKEKAPVAPAAPVKEEEHTPAPVAPTEPKTDVETEDEIL